MKVYARVPVLPNFVTLCREQGGVEVGQVSVGDLTDEDIVDLGKRWTEALLAHAKRKRMDNDEAMRKRAACKISRSTGP